jgi:hypothetical protein
LNGLTPDSREAISGRSGGNPPLICHVAAHNFSLTPVE